MKKKNQDKLKIYTPSNQNPDSNEWVRKAKEHEHKQPQASATIKAHNANKPKPSLVHKMEC